MRPDAGRVWLALGSTLLCLAVAEGVARLAARQRRGGKEGGEQALYTAYDPLLGWSKVPGASVTYRRREYTVEVRINSHGLRDVERPPAPSAAALRILALGDSFVEGYTVPLDQTVTQVLEKALPCRAEVVNGGTAAYSTDQEYLFYREEGVKYGAGIVLLFFYYNDVVYNDRQEYSGAPKPIFEQRADGLDLHRYPVRRPPAAAPRREVDPEAAAEATTVRGSAALGFLRERLWYGAPRAYQLLARSGLWPPVRQVPRRLELRVYQGTRIREIEEAWTKTEAILEALERSVSASGARLLIVYVPSRMEVDERSWALSRVLYGMDDGWDRARVAERLLRIGRELGMPVLDLTPSLRAADDSLWSGRPYFTYDGHWTAVGHRTAAAAIRAFLSSAGWLGSCGAGL